MANTITPVVYDGPSRDMKPASIGDQINPVFIALDPNSNNLLENTLSSGLAVRGNNLVSGDSGNMLTVSPTDGKLFVSSGGGSGSGIISQQPGNYARLGSDGGVFIDGNDILANGIFGNLLHMDPQDNKITLTAADITAAIGGGGGGTIQADVTQLKSDMTVVKNDVTVIKGDITTLRNDVNTNARDIADLKRDVQDIVVVSTDRNNILTAGRDGGAYLNSADISIDVRDLINPNDPLLSTRNDKIFSNLSLRYNAVTGLVEILGVQGTPIASATIPTALTMLRSVNLVDNPAGQPAGTYIHFQFSMQDGSTTDMYLNVNRLAQAYSAGNGIDIDTTGKISVVTSYIENIAEDVIDDELGNRGKITTAIDNAIDNINIVSTDANNIITAGRDDGAYLDGNTIITVIGSSIEALAVTAIEQAIAAGKVHIVSQNANNQLTAGTDGGAFLAKATITNAVKDELAAKNLNLISADAGNLVKAGTDGLVFLDPNDVPSGVSADTGNLLKLGTDNKPFLDPADVPSGVSADTGNGLTLGSDNKPYFPLDYGTL